MVIDNMTILLVSPEPWTHLFVSKHHYAVHLAARGNRVFFLNPPSQSTQIIATSYPNLSVVDYRGFWSGLRLLPAPLRKWHTRRVFNQLEQQCGVSFDIIWSFDNSLFFQMDALPAHVLKISHIVDLNMDFQMKLATTTASICFCTTQLIADKMRRFRSSGIHQINHGLHVSSSPAAPKALPGIHSAKAVYAGNLAMAFLDWQILEEVTRQHPRVDFIFFGSNATLLDVQKYPHHKYKAALAHMPNVHFAGVLSSDELAATLPLADMLLVSYQEAHHPDQANPHKVLEYLHTGKPIVATYTAEYAGKDLLYMAKRNADWPGLFAKIVQDLPAHSTPELSAKRRAFALENTYDKQIDRIEKLLLDLTILHK
jgi:glycosyltransferase involved in cell wall biosynthesis